MAKKTLHSRIIKFNNTNNEVKNEPVIWDTATSGGSDDLNLHKVSKTGEYLDLLHAPEILNVITASWPDWDVAAKNIEFYILPHSAVNFNVYGCEDSEYGKMCLSLSTSTITKDQAHMMADLDCLACVTGESTYWGQQVLTLSHTYVNNTDRVITIYLGTRKIKLLKYTVITYSLKKEQAAYGGGIYEEDSGLVSGAYNDGWRTDFRINYYPSLNLRNIVLASDHSDDSYITVGTPYRESYEWIIPYRCGKESNPTTVYSGHVYAYYVTVSNITPN